MEHDPLEPLEPLESLTNDASPLEDVSPFEEDSPFDEDVESASQPSVSVSDRPGTSQEENAWPEVEASRWVDTKNEAAMEAWGTGPEVAQPRPFDPSSAYVPPSTSEGRAGGEGDAGKEEDSDSNRSGNGWQNHQANGVYAKGGLNPRQADGLFRRINEDDYPPAQRDSHPFVKRQRLDETAVEERLRYSNETVLTEEMAEDEERSSGDFQDPEDDIPDEAILRPLDEGQRRGLVNLSEEGLLEYGESDESDDGSSDSDSPPPKAPPCRNCISELDPFSTVCPECGHDSKDDALLFEDARLDEESGASGREVVLAYDSRLLEHEEGKAAPHPERSDRVAAVVARLMATGLAGQCKQIRCREASREEVTACHTWELMHRVEEQCRFARRQGEEIGVPTAYLGPDTYVREASYSCALLAAGGCVEAATAVVRGEAKHGAAIVRPPGHHAESNVAMGFCLFNNAAIAARAAQKAGAKKVMILDWDIHHGNGTQHIFEHDPSVLYMSLHRWEGGHFFPGTGGPREVGKGRGEGFTVNIPWTCGGLGDADYMAAFHHIVLPIASEFAPDLLIISAGFDAAEGDPLGGCKVSSAGFGQMTALLASVAPLALLLEGGYNLSATAAGTEASLRVLLGERPPPIADPGAVNSLAASAIREVVRIQARYWRSLQRFIELWGFDPYATPFGAREAMEAPSSPMAPHPTPSGSRSEDLGGGLLIQRGEMPPMPASPQVLSRALNRSKWSAQRRQGKSCRRLNYMHALHLVALRQRLRASRAVSQKLTVKQPLRSVGFRRLGSDTYTASSPSPRAAHRGTPRHDNPKHHGTADERTFDSLIAPLPFHGPVDDLPAKTF